MNIGDELLVRSLPNSKGTNDGNISDTAPAAGENGGRILPDDADKKKLNADELGLVKTPLVLDLIRDIK